MIESRKDSLTLGRRRRRRRCLSPIPASIHPSIHPSRVHQKCKNNFDLTKINVVRIFLANFIHAAFPRSPPHPSSSPRDICSYMTDCGERLKGSSKQRERSIFFIVTFHCTRGFISPLSPCSVTVLHPAKII